MTIQLVIGDISDQPGLDAVVNAANAELMPGGGVAGAIHTTAGPELARACRPLAPIRPGEAVITEAFGLPNRHVIHALGPRHGIDEPGAELLAAAYRNALRLCAENSITSVGFPAISAGAFGYPLTEAALIALTTTNKKAATDLEVTFVLFDQAAFDTFEAVLSRL